jgi:hypothetical protein
MANVVGVLRVDKPVNDHLAILGHETDAGRLNRILKQVTELVYFLLNARAMNNGELFQQLDNYKEEKSLKNQREAKLGTQKIDYLPPISLCTQ